jgi:phytoene dehydrogenase-like protein
LKLVGFLPYDLAEGGPSAWDAIKDEVSDALLERYLAHASGVSRADILARHVESPLDLERRNPHNHRGSCHGGDQASGEDGTPPPWAGHRTPLPGLYQTGASTHGGASVSGAPGRNCAEVLLADLGFRLADAVALPVSAR